MFTPTPLHLSGLSGQKRRMLLSSAKNAIQKGKHSLHTFLPCALLHPSLGQPSSDGVRLLETSSPQSVSHFFHGRSGQKKHQSSGSGGQQQMPALVQRLHPWCKVANACPRCSAGRALAGHNTSMAKGEMFKTALEVVMMLIWTLAAASCPAKGATSAPRFHLPLTFY